MMKDVILLFGMFKYVVSNFIYAEDYQQNLQKKTQNRVGTTALFVVTFKTIHLVKFNQGLLPLIDFVMVAILGSYEFVISIAWYAQKKGK